MIGKLIKIIIYKFEAQSKRLINPNMNIIVLIIR